MAFDELFRVFATVLGVVGPLIAALYWAVGRRIDKLEKHLESARDNFTSKEMCALRHESIERLLRAEIRPLSDVIAKLCNGGEFSKLSKRVSELEKGV